MASLIQITKASKSYGDQVLLDGADATLSDNVKVGFVGRNGAGKSTLLRVLLGEEELAFSHILTRDVAYESLPYRERPKAHARVAPLHDQSLELRIRPFRQHHLERDVFIPAASVSTRHATACWPRTR